MGAAEEAFRSRSHCAFLGSTHAADRAFFHICNRCIRNIRCYPRTVKVTHGYTVQKRTVIMGQKTHSVNRALTRRECMSSSTVVSHRPLPTGPDPKIIYAQGQFRKCFFFETRFEIARLRFKVAVECDKSPRALSCT